MSLLSVPLKTVLLYHADVQNETIPESYEVCDGRTLNSSQQDVNPGGTYTLPNLLNTFPLFADLTKAATNAGDYTVTGPAGAPGPKGTGGANVKTLSTTELPVHTHTATTSTAGAHAHAGSTANTGGNHAHTASSTSAGSHSHTISDPGHSHGGPSGQSLIVDTGSSGHAASSQGGQWTPVGSTASAVTNISVQSGGTHSHPITVDAGGDHSHTLTVVSDGGHSHTFTTDATGGGTSYDTRPRFYGLVPIMKVRK